MRPHDRLTACSVTGFLHQLHGVIRSRFYRTFERFRIPDVTSHDGQHSHRVKQCHHENIPNEKTVEFDVGHLRIPILVQGRANVEHREHACDNNVYCPESEVPTGTDPGDHGYDYSSSREG